eukprot:6460502-Amphidinium_carterae.1
MELGSKSTTSAMLDLQRVRRRVLHDDGEALVVQHLVAERGVFFFQLLCRETCERTGTCDMTENQSTTALEEFHQNS